MADNEQGPASGLTPHLTIGHNRTKDAITFYKKAFAATEARPPHLSDDKQRIMHAHLTVNGASLMLNDDFPEFHGGGYGMPAATTLHLQVDDADAWWQRALDAGATVRFPLVDQFWGDRYGQLDDPFGFTWSIGAPTKGDQPA